jgi:hypothetical protein
LRVRQWLAAPFCRAVGFHRRAGHDALLAFLPGDEDAIRESVAGLDRG